MTKKVRAFIFDLDNTLVDSYCAKADRDNGDWDAACEKIDEMFCDYYLKNFLLAVKKNNEPIAVVTRSLNTSSTGWYVSNILLKKMGFLSKDLVIKSHVGRKKAESFQSAFDDMEKRINSDMRPSDARAGEKIEIGEVIVVGDEESDIVAAEKFKNNLPRTDITVKTVLAAWYKNKDVVATDYSQGVLPDYLCSNVPYFVSLFSNNHKKLISFYQFYRENKYKFLYDYYPTGVNAENYVDNASYDYVAVKNDSDEPLDLVEEFMDVVLDTADSLAGNTAIAIVPSSKKDKWNYNLQKALFRRLREDSPVLNYYGLFRRIKDKDSSHLSGERNIAANTSTMELSSDYDLANVDNLIILDDVITTGTSFDACQEILEKAKLENDINVFNMAILGTTHGNFDEHKRNEDKCRKLVAATEPSYSVSSTSYEDFEPDE